MKKYFFAILFSLFLLISFQIKAAPTSVSPASLPNWYGSSSSHQDATSGGATAIGDFNCDGINDIIFGVASYSSGKGRIYVQYGSSSLSSGSTSLSTSSTLDVLITGTTSYTECLAVNLIATDIDGDSCDDIVAASGCGTDDLHVYLGDTSWSGSYTNGSSVYSNMISTSSNNGYGYLHLLGPLDGDITGDGVTDDLDNYLAMCSSSTATCFLLPVMNLISSGTIEELSTYEITNGDEIDQSVTSGDVDGDGNEDLIVGEASDYNDTEGVYIFFGPLSTSSSLQYDASETPANYFEVGTISGEDVVIRDADETRENFGNFVKTSSLIDSGHDDLIIGSTEDDNGSYTYSGHYHIISGESIKDFRDTYSSTSGYVICSEDTTGSCTSTHTYNYTNLEMFYYTGDADESSYGSAYNAYSGDFNGDGFTDLALGSMSYDTADGALHIVYGGNFDSLISTGDEYHLGAGEANSDYYMLGSSGDRLATNVIAGDVTGDGYDDLIVTASGAVGGYGATYLWVGGATTTYYLDGDGDGFGDPGSSIQNTSLPSGYVANDSDCDDTDATLTTATTYYVDSDGDGFGSTTSAELCTASMPAGYSANSDDCDDTNSSVYETTTYYIDADSDGYGSSTTAEVCDSSSRLTGYASVSGDCNDSNSAIHPSATETCDGDDNDCDGSTDEGVLSTYYRDSDSDTYGDASTTTTGCSAPSGYVATATDCDDTNSATHPGATETCDGEDNDCDGSTDEGVSSTTYYEDADSDGYGDSSASVSTCSKPSGYVTDGTDCDDTNASVHPGATEVCDSVDNDCDSSVDEGLTSTYYLDSDADGYGDASTSTTACTAPSGYVSNDSDCDDSEAQAYPGNTEICDGIDNDCDSSTSEDSSADAATWYMDADGDSYGNASSHKTACSQPTNYVENSDDCDDSNASVNPGKTEVCDGVDNDCNAATDEDTYATDTLTWYADNDSDSYGNASASTQACSKPTGYVFDSTDCDDTNASAYPGNSETASECGDGVDQNCDGSDLSCSGYDLDGDGHLSITDGGDDCDDTNGTVHPGATEVCDGLDNDCDASTDEDDVAPGTLTWFADHDGDGYGDASDSTTACFQPTHYVEDDSDCNDTDATINPEGAEICGDDVDQNCDEIDLTCNDLDEDGDGYVGTDDCDDTNPTVYPNAEELGDAIDNDCDGNIDEGLVDTTLTYIDDTVTAGDRFAMQVAISNSSGLRSFEIQVLVQSEPTSMGMTSGSSVLKYFSFGNWSCAADAVTGESGCDEVYDVNKAISNSGSVNTITLMPLMPTDRTSGNYYVEVRLISRDTGETTSTTQSGPYLIMLAMERNAASSFKSKFKAASTSLFPNASSSSSSIVSPMIHVE